MWALVMLLLLLLATPLPFTSAYYRRCDYNEDCNGPGRRLRGATKAWTQLESFSRLRR